MPSNQQTLRQDEKESKGKLMPLFSFKNKKLSTMKFVKQYLKISYLFLIMGSGIFLIMSGCETEDTTGCMNSRAPNFDPGASEECEACCKKEIRYVVDGDFTNVDITYKDENEKEQTVEDVNSDWSKELNIKVKNELYLKAVDKGDPTREKTISLTIFENGGRLNSTQESDDDPSPELEETVTPYL